MAVVAAVAAMTTTEVMAVGTNCNQLNSAAEEMTVLAAAAVVVEVVVTGVAVTLAMATTTATTVAAAAATPCLEGVAANMVFVKTVCGSRL